MGEARAHEVDSSHGSGFACPLQNYDSVCVRDFLVSGRVKKNNSQSGQGSMALKFSDWKYST
jgi:hypothetical protein